MESVASNRWERALYMFLEDYWSIYRARLVEVESADYKKLYEIELIIQSILGKA